jgi:hypothetical protein
MSHEDLTRDHAVEGTSDGRFGLVFAALFAIIGLVPLIHGGPPRAWALALAAAILIVALARPQLLRPLNRYWTRLGLLLHRVASPIVMALLFFVVMTPLAFLLRRLGKDPLRLRFDPAAASYWIDRVPPGPPPDSIRNQF